MLASPFIFMLPAQFLKAAGRELEDFELSLIGLTPIYKENLPKTKAEEDALKKLMANPATGMGGTFTLDSTIGQGTAITLCVPYSRRSNPQPLKRNQQ